MTIRVFLAEDNAKIRESLIPALADLGAADVIGVAESEDEAIRLLADHEVEWEIAVLDFALKQGTALGIIRWCKRYKPHRIVVVLSNISNPATRAACMAAGADRMFDKSTELEDFFDYCSEVDRHARQR